jgi:chemotaxis protein MotB
MESSGVRSDQIVQVRGYADRKLRKPLLPLDASNRRITVLIQYMPESVPQVVTVNHGALPKMN